MPIYNPWHGCHKISAGCKNCYVYRRGDRYGEDSSIVYKTQSFDLPVRIGRGGYFKLVSDEIVYTCFTSDFFIEEADEWRRDVWKMIKKRPDLTFLIITKRIHRFSDCVPDDWGDGYENVIICSTCENQDRADFRLPILLQSKIKHKMIICEPLLEGINLSRYLAPEIEGVVVGGESGDAARICDYSWVLSIREQCIKANIPFHFKQTGAHFVYNGKLYNIKRKFQHSQAASANIDYNYNYKT